MPVTIVGNNTPTAGSVVYGDGTNYASTAAGTSGQPLVSGGSGAPTFRPYTLPAADGTASQVLQTNGSGALSFATPATGSMVLLTSGTVSGSPTAIDVETGFTDSSYALILIYYENITSSSGSGIASFRFKLSGSYSSSAAYATRQFETATSSSSVSSTSSATSMVLSGLPQITTAGTSFALVIQNRFQGGTTGAAFITNPWWGHQNNGTAAGTNYGFIAASGDVQGLRFLMTGGSGATNFGAGTYYAYGIKTT